ncbi:ATPase, T2SS/T4P/T4SS family [Desulfopila aestuarii]|uniref:Type II secretory pathway ATPase GspE/PulE or T4P pilus assembly pathway ATPase PilB n=1 Tax=Desulfopila aestuarii DSM 18488 TaxID=1121416 RepID=A0A1M7YMB1_9BACT|nr:ATPase, T2SS/T4P/T4SS family [Desulfopila aestuarii]SHO53735.1 Type II secretory pathway ATPase GspE/PulE or T4P pilus assembly pathway ATPase PilB [Desulfopila aestuarii DSM 18488]
MNNQSDKPAATHKKSPSALTLQSLLEAIKDAPDVKSINDTLKKHILEVFQAKIAAIFLADNSKQELDSWLLLPGDSSEKIVIPINYNSIVGFAAKKKQPINLRDAYDFRELRRVGPELNFYATYDEKSNIRSKQILAIPIVQNNTLMGVLEFINTRDDNHFTSEEEYNANQLAKALATAFSNHGIFVKQIPPQYESLLSQNLLSVKELEQGLAKATELGEDPETVLMNNFQIPRLKMGKLLAEFYSTRFVDLDKVDNNPQQLFPDINIDYFEEKDLVPLSLKDEKLVVAVKNFEDQTLTSTIQEQVSGKLQVELVFAFQGDIRSFWKRTRAKYFSRPDGESEGQQLSKDSSSFDTLEDYKTQRKERITYDTSLFDSLQNYEYQGDEQLFYDNSLFDPLEETEPQDKIREKQVTAGESRAGTEKHVEINDYLNIPAVVRLVYDILQKGYSSQASDIHIDPCGFENKGEVRYRIHGVFSKPLKIPQKHAYLVVDRIKSQASLNLAERTKPQEGKFKFTTLEGKEIELRVATTPTPKGNEEIVLSILPNQKPLPLLGELLPSRLLGPFKEMIEQEEGIILVVGPKASGKTTTLHSALNHLKTAGKKICAAEQPLEIKQNGIHQVEVDPLKNYSFTDALGEFRKEDPDVIMIGEMQDLRTALMVVDVALNGHLLLTSLAADSAEEGITHCLNMGLDPLLLATALRGVLAQRLVRTLCKNCKQPYHPEKAEYDRLLESYGVSFFDHINVIYSDDLVFHRANGCPRCDGSGYDGKIGLYELLVVNPSISELIMSFASPAEIVDEAMSNGMTLLVQEGIQLIFNGTIDCKELMSVCEI